MTYLGTASIQEKKKTQSTQQDKERGESRSDKGKRREWTLKKKRLKGLKHKEQGKIHNR